jgi:hypothetical protein
MSSSRIRRHTRECLDQVIVATTLGCGGLLRDYLTYYRHTRTQLAGQGPPLPRHHIELARMSSPLAAVRLSITSDGSSSTVDPSVDTSKPLRRDLSWMASA